MAGSLSKQCDIQIADWAEAIRRSALQEMLIDASQPDIISFALGLPAPELFPGPDIAQAVESVLAADPNALQYGPPCQLLKEHIVRIMAKRGVECHQQEVFITSGAQQGMSLLTRLLLNPGGTVITEDLTYTGFSQVLQPFAPRLLTVATDAETGMDVEAVERYLKKGERPAFIYTIAEGHNPLGVSLSPEKRAHLLKLARHYSVPLLEDDAYGFLQYGTKSKPPLRSMDDQWVLYLG